MTALLPKDMLSLKDFSLEALQEILQRAAYYKKKDGDVFSSLKGKNIAISFWEPSTRTRISFELAVQKLGGRIINFIPELSSEKKGENADDTIKTLQSIGADALVFRHSSPGIFHRVSQFVEIPFISGGEGCYQHPTQALLDIFTLLESGVKLSGLQVVMVGDILHSRVARSHFYAFPVFGANLTLVAPPVLLPLELVPPGVNWSYNLEEVLPSGDIIYLLRVQKERQGKSLIPSLGEYTALYGLNEKRLSLLKEDACLMHPGPVNIGIEISSGVIKTFENVYPDRILFQDQVRNGVYVRMAVLDLLLAGRVI
ncbi:MAG: aspartate carbamoyltransferase catalytic subunit [Dethiobacter sp.]|jgi:aspartate carbamoyltransferase catalytic subunit|nr:MAG: aspartate carbamoyltransferase catalytic subunit [Dethiobacter sp.]